MQASRGGLGLPRAARNTGLSTNSLMSGQRAGRVRLPGSPTSPPTSHPRRRRHRRWPAETLLQRHAALGLGPPPARRRNGGRWRSERCRRRTGGCVRPLRPVCRSAPDRSSGAAVAQECSWLIVALAHAPAQVQVSASVVAAGTGAAGWEVSGRHTQWRGGRGADGIRRNGRFRAQRGARLVLNVGHVCPVRSGAPATTPHGFRSPQTSVPNNGLRGYGQEGRRHRDRGHHR